MLKNRREIIPMRTIKIHGQGSGATQTKTNIMERSSFKETHAKEQKRQPPLDPTRAVKVHGQGSGATQMQPS